MRMTILEAILIAISLCADCFAVSMCSSVTIERISFRRVTVIALSFAVIQTGLLLCGWAFGSIFVGLLRKVSHLVGFLLLLYVGGSMLIEGVRNESEVRNLCGIRNILIGGVATSIDALAVGAARSMGGDDWSVFLPLPVSVFVVTAISVVAGILGGEQLGKSFGRVSEIIGGLILIGIGLSMLLR